ncbi:MAG: hypothetical protein JSR59_12040 [Proteobacteria bacterium]|nr:hypothetical protein [Pseudomonadota bacterium]
MIASLRDEAIREANNASARAVNAMWSREVEIVRSGGEANYRWTFAQARELLTTGKLNGIQVHHIEPVSVRPDLAGDMGNLRFIRQSEHIELHRKEGSGW